MIVCTGVGPTVWRYITIPVVANAAGRNALSPVHTGMTCTRADKGWTEVYDGTAWRTVGTVAVTAGTDITHPYVDQQVVLLADHLTYRYTGSAWVRMAYSRVLGGRLAADAPLGAVADVAGCTTGAFTVDVAAVAVMTMDAAVTSTGNNYGAFYFNIDAADHATFLQVGQNGLAVQGHSSKTLSVNLAAGSHTIKMRATHSGGATTAKLQQTGLTVTVIGS
jgi:hypothetical protein